MLIIFLDNRIFFSFSLFFLGNEGFVDNLLLGGECQKMQDRVPVKSSSI